MTRDAVAILKARYIGIDPERAAQYEATKAEAEKVAALVNEHAIRALTEAGWTRVSQYVWAPGPDAKTPEVPGVEEIGDMIAEVVLDWMGKHAKSWGIVEVGVP